MNVWIFQHAYLFTKETSGFRGGLVYELRGAFRSFRPDRISDLAVPFAVGESAESFQRRSRFRAFSGGAGATERSSTANWKSESYALAEVS